MKIDTGHRFKSSIVHQNSSHSDDLQFSDDAGGTQGQVAPPESESPPGVARALAALLSSLEQTTALLEGEFDGSRPGWRGVRSGEAHALIARAKAAIALGRRDTQQVAS